MLSKENDVVVLCEGDPFYGSFMHLHTRMRDKVDIEVVPGITGMSACWTSLGNHFVRAMIVLCTREHLKNRKY